MNAQLLEDAFQMEADAVVGNAEFAREFLVRSAGRQRPEDIGLALAELARRRPCRTIAIHHTAQKVQLGLVRIGLRGQLRDVIGQIAAKHIGAGLAHPGCDAQRRQFGNLAQRSLSMVAKNLEATVPQPGDFSAADRELLTLADELLDKVRGHYDATAMHLALEAIWSVLGAANRYFSAQEPWVLRKTDPDRFATVLDGLVEGLRDPSR